MPIRIKEINVQHLGPIEKLSVKFGIFNLIYGLNEEGKTYLVEFLVRSLFKNQKSWRLRSLRAMGKVVLTGLPDGSVTFSPSSEKKLEDYWEETNIGLPPDFSKLLVVKGAEVEIANVESGVDKAILKRYLSRKEILDKIEKKISSTIKDTKVGNGTIIGPNRGEIKTKEELGKKIKNIDVLFNEIDQLYSGGKRKTLKFEKNVITNEIERLQKAKQYLAHELDGQIRELKVERDQIENNKFQDLKKDIHLFRQKKSEIKKKAEVLKKSAEKCQHYEWLTSARGLYQDILNEKIPSPFPILLIFVLLLIISAGLFTFLKIPLFVITSIGLALLLGLLYLLRYRKLTTQMIKREEMTKLQIEFRRKFEKDLTGLPLIMDLIKSMEEDYSTTKFLKRQVSDDLHDLDLLKSQINNHIYELTGEQKETVNWDEVIKSLSSKLNELEEAIREKEIQLGKLDVDSSDYLTEKPDTEYSKEQLDKLHKQLDSINTEIKEETNNLEDLKHRICEQTGDDISIEWESIINNLRVQRKATINEHKSKTAEILGKLAIYQVTEELRRKEDVKINEGLKSKEVQIPLYELTHRYNNIDLQGEKLVVSDAYNNFDISDLSTGAQEQILLALRIGFSTKILKQDALFLILDDAFQYSDWNRRLLLTEKIVELAQKGWQIIYFTMDDHIRKLIDEKGKLFGDEYQFYELIHRSN